MKDNGKHKHNWRLLSGLGAASFMATSLALAPASLYASFVDFDNQNIAYSKIEGTVWSGSVDRLTVNGVSLGSVDFQLSPLSLLTLSPKVAIKARDGAVLGRGVVSVGPGSRLAISDVNARVDLGAAASSGVLGQPTQGFAELDIDEFVFTKTAGCKKASGAVWTDVLNAPARRYEIPELPLNGSLHCEDGASVVELSGENARASVDLDVRVLPNLTYEITATARPAQAEVASALRYFGFEDQNGALTYGAAGVFKGPGS